MRKGMLAGTIVLAAAAAPSPAERVVTGDGIAAITVNGTAVRLRVEPGAPGLPIVAPAVAERIGLKGGGLMGFGVMYRIGRDTVGGRTAVARVGWREGAKPEGKRVGWMSRDYPMPADGSVGPGGVPEPVVRFVLRAPGDGERTAALPIADGTGLFGGWGAMTGRIVVAGEPVTVRIDPHHPLTLVNAPAGARIAAAFGGTLTTETARQEIAFGVERPLRTMTLARPLPLGPLQLSRLAVRITDGAGANTIPEEGADPNEVVVTGKGKRQLASLTLGADALARCSSVVFDKPKKEIRLTCR